MNTNQDSNFLEKNVSYYKSITQKNNVLISLSEVFKAIQSGSDFKNIIEGIRNEKDKDKKDKLKKALPAITPSATFGEQRKNEFIKSYNALICLDFDKISDLQKKKTALSEDKYCMAVFISPSGNGLKFFAKVDGDSKGHLENFNTLKDYILKTFQIEADKACSDVTRLMYLSYDKDLFQNSNSIVWSAKNYHFKIYEVLDKELGRTETFIEGNRNNYVFQLAKKSRDAGLKYDFVLKEISSQYAEQGHDVTEIHKTVKSAYSKEPVQVNKETDTTGIKSYTLWDKVEEYLSEHYELRNNIVSVKIEFRKKYSDSEFEELDENSIYRELQKKGVNISQAKLNAMLGSDFVEQYNPILDYFENLSEWNDETEPDYILHFASFIPMKDQERFNTDFKKMFVRCIACSIDNKIFNKHVFVFVHSEQNSGKTSLCRFFVPQKLKPYYTENVNMSDKDGQIALASNFMINLDELAALYKSEGNKLKTFISQDYIKERMPYGRRPVQMPRRANFVATTNNDEFLNDPTGSIRFLCHEMNGNINFNYSNEVDIVNVWRQAHTLYKMDFQYQLTKEELAESEKANQKHQVITFESQIVPEYFSPSTKEDGGKFVTTTEIYSKISLRNPTMKFTLASLGKALRMLGYKPTQNYFKDRGQSLKGYYVNELK